VRATFAVSVFVAILSLAKIIIGFLYRGDCEINPRIPVWLIVDGSMYIYLTMIAVVLNIWFFRMRFLKEKLINFDLN
jgi:hypothetical protein